ncbi:MAG: type II toxin-antitoxin system VapC family toxin [Anaerolineae bacterium]|nr:type II toxin-antitoxin system VapC family toxin [Anaerolineae bacterium]
MIVYADTSALVKLFVTEEGAEETREMLSGAQIVGTGVLTWAELVAALARGVRRGYLGEGEAEEAVRSLGEVWDSWVRVRVDEGMVRRAGDMAWEYGLRGYDAVHLAAALVWQEGIGYPVVLATFDRELWAAAKYEGLEVWPKT